MGGTVRVVGDAGVGTCRRLHSAHASSCCWWMSVVGSDPVDHERPIATRTESPESFMALIVAGWKKTSTSGEAGGIEAHAVRSPGVTEVVAWPPEQDDATVPRHPNTSNVSLRKRTTAYWHEYRFGPAEPPEMCLMQRP